MREGGIRCVGLLAAAWLLGACAGSGDAADDDKEPTESASPTGDTGADDTPADDEATATTGDTGTPPLPSGVLTDTCSAARAENPLLPGRYRGTTAGLADDLDPPASCVGAGGGPGADVIGRVVIPSGQLLTAQLVHAAGTVWLAEDCDVATSCVDGASEGGVSTVRRYNGTGQPLELFVVVDGTEEAGQAYVLDLSLQSASFEPLFDACAQAAYGPRQGSGTFVTTTEGGTDQTDPEEGTCGLEDDQDGPERLFPVEVGAERAVTIDAPVGAYVLEDCEDPVGTCLTSASSGPLTWYNPSPISKTVIVALEAPAAEASEHFEVEVSVNPLGVDDAPESCLVATQELPFGPGTYTVSLQGRTDEVSPSCLPAAPQGTDELVIPVGVPAGAQAELTFDPPVTAYWVGNCVNPSGSCLGGAVATSSLRWYNDDATDELVYAVLESSGANPAAVEVVLRNQVRSLDPVAETCDGALKAAPITSSGLVEVPLSGATNDFDANSPDLGNPLPPCGLGVPLTGSDRVLPVTVPALERLTVRVVDDSDAQVSLLTDCADPATCEEAAGLGGAVDFLNLADEPVTVYVVVDSPAGTAPGIVALDVQLDAPALLGGADTCDDLGSAVAPGVYADRLEGITNALEPKPGECVDVPSFGTDLIVPIDVPAGERLDVRLAGGANQVYVLEDCQDVESCLQGADVDLGPLSWANDTLTSASVALAIDSSLPIEAGELGDLDVQVDIDVGPSALLPGGDLCADAEAAAALAPGAYHGTTAGLADDLQAAACLGSAAEGPDQIVAVDLALDSGVEITGWGSGVRAYFVDDCNKDSTCRDPAMAGGEPGAFALRTYNLTGAPVRRYLVIDGNRAATDVALEVSEFPIVVGAPEDDCLDAALQPSLTAGVHRWAGSLAGLTDDLDPAAAATGSCTGRPALGEEAFVPVELAPGETLRATLTQTGADGALYLLTDCTSANNCVAGVDVPGGPDTIVYTHTGSARQQYFLALDALVGAGDFLLKVQIGG